MAYLLDLFIGLGQEGLGLGKKARLQISLGEGLHRGGGGGARGVRVVSGVLNLLQLKGESVLGLGELVLQVRQLGGVSLGGNRGDQLLDGSLLVLHHSGLVSVVLRLQLLHRLIGLLQQVVAAGDQGRLQVANGATLNERG